MTEEEWNAKYIKLKSWVIGAPIAAAIVAFVLGIIVGEIL